MFTSEGQVWGTIHFIAGIALYLPVIVIIYFHAEHRGESGLLWGIAAVCLPILGPLLYVAWNIFKFIGNRKAGHSRVTAFSTPDVVLSRQRLDSIGFMAGQSIDEIDKLLIAENWDEAANLVDQMIKDAEEKGDHKTVADMITYKEKIKKGKRG